MSAACPVCNGSGESIRHSGIYDCQAPDCTAAQERTALEARIVVDRDPMVALWDGYRAGQAVALEQAAEDAEYELVQDDMVVAGTSGPSAKQEIQHYAMVYSQDGPVEIIEVTRRKLVAGQ